MYDGLAVVLRGLLLIAAWGACLWSIFAGPTPESVVTTLALGGAWYGLSKRKERGLDAPRPR